jgi:hypothetical protein
VNHHLVYTQPLHWVTQKWSGNCFIKLIVLKMLKVVYYKSKKPNLDP